LAPAALGIAQLVGDPDIAETVDREAAAGEAGLESHGLGWVGGREARDVVAKNVGDPDVVFLVDCQPERYQELAGIFQGIAAGVLAEDLALGGIALR